MEKVCSVRSPLSPSRNDVPRWQISFIFCSRIINDGINLIFIMCTRCDEHISVLIIVVSFVHSSFFQLFCWRARACPLVLFEENSESPIFMKSLNLKIITHKSSQSVRVQVKSKKHEKIKITSINSSSNYHKTLRIHIHVQ